jgi:aminoglycoside phosphotransferase (APT) family kinase protein
VSAPQVRTATRRDPQQTRALLEIWLAQQLPGASDLRVEPLPGPSATGFSNETLLFDFVWREDGREVNRPVVVRCAPTGEGVFPEYDIARQHRVLEILAGSGIPVPRVFWLEPTPTLLGVPFYVMERVEGRIPTDNPPYHAGGWVTEISPEERAELWWGGIDVLARIHRLDWKALDLGFLDTPGTGVTPLERQLDYYRRFLSWAARGKPQPVCAAALTWLQRERPKEQARVAFCWGDARPGNIIFREGSVAAVLDWEMATLGDPQQDLAWWLFLDRHHSEGLGLPRLPGFPAREETVMRWEQLSGHRANHLHYYEVFAAFRFSVIMIRVARQLAESGFLPAGSDFETNNIVTRLLARMLSLPAPG